MWMTVRSCLHSIITVFPLWIQNKLSGHGAFLILTPEKRRRRDENRVIAVWMCRVKWVWEAANNLAMVLAATLHLSHQTRGGSIVQPIRWTPLRRPARCFPDPDENWLIHCQSLILTAKYTYIHTYRSFNIELKSKSAITLIIYWFHVAKEPSICGDVMLFLSEVILKHNLMILKLWSLKRKCSRCYLWILSLFSDIVKTTRFISYSCFTPSMDFHLKICMEMYKNWLINTCTRRPGVHSRHSEKRIQTFCITAHI